MPRTIPDSFGRTPAAEFASHPSGYEGDSPEPPPFAAWSDATIAAVLLAGALILSMALAVRLRAETAALDRRASETAARVAQLRQEADRLELRRRAMARLQREIRRYVEVVEARRGSPCTLVLDELSRARPGGVWATGIAGDGTRFAVQAAAHRADLVAAYVQRLRRSPHVEAVEAEPAAGATGSGAAPVPGPVRIAGRLAGEGE